MKTKFFTLPCRASTAMLLILVSAQAAADKRVQKKDEIAASLKDGENIYRDNCAPCHGPTGNGDGAIASSLKVKPRNYHSEKFKFGSTRAKIVETIDLGRNEGLMPSFKGALSTKQMEQVADFIWRWIPANGRDLPPTVNTDVRKGP